MSNTLCRKTSKKKCRSGNLWVNPCLWLIYLHITLSTSDVKHPSATSSTWQVLYTLYILILLLPKLGGLCVYTLIYIYIMYTNIFFVASNAGWQNTTDTKNSCSQVAINNPFRWIFILRCRGCLDTSKRRRNLSGARINQDEWKWRSPSILLLARV